MPNKIYVGNISSTTTDKDLFDLFNQYGSVVSVKVIFGIDNQNTRHGYVMMSEKDDVQKVINKTNNVTLKGTRIRVVKAHPIDQKDDYFSSQNRYRQFRKR